MMREKLPARDLLAEIEKKIHLNKSSKILCFPSIRHFVVWEKIHFLNKWNIELIFNCVHASSPPPPRYVLQVYQ